MGLDVYLYRYENYADTTQREQTYERESEAVWSRVSGGLKYEQLTETQKEQARSAAATVAVALGLDNCGSDESGKTKIEIDSAKYPQHYFKVGYFRSSYNDAGIDRVLEARIGTDLAAICGYTSEYAFQPDWLSMRSLAERALADLKTANQKRPFRAVSVSPNPFGGSTFAKSEAAALDVFDKVRARQHSDGAFGCQDGDFWLGDPLKVRGAIAGDGSFGPCMYLVYEDSADNLAWYEQALEIVIETADYVLAQADPQKFWLHWSG
jgi:hypothetical protein